MADNVVYYPPRSGSSGGNNQTITIQTPVGTFPVLNTASSVLNITTGDSSVMVTGTAGSDSVDIAVNYTTLSNIYVQKAGDTIEYLEVVGDASSGSGYVYFSNPSGTPSITTPTGIAISAGTDDAMLAFSFVASSGGNLLYLDFNEMVNNYTVSMPNLDAATYHPAFWEDTEYLNITGSSRDDTGYLLFSELNSSAFGVTPSKGILIYGYDDASFGVYLATANVYRVLHFNTGETGPFTYNFKAANGTLAFVSDVDSVQGQLALYLTLSGAAQMTGKLTCVTASTSSASINMPSGAAPTSPVAGDFWLDSTQKCITTFTDGVKQSASTTLFTQTADATVTNTVTETSILGTGVGTKTLPANFFVAGKTIRLRVGGVYSTPITGAVATIKIKLGSTVIATVATTSLLANASSLEFDGEALITCRTTGASGSVMVHGDLEYATGVAGTISVDSLNNGGATTTVDTTASKVIDVTVTWDTAASTKIVKSTICTIEVLN